MPPKRAANPDQTAVEQTVELHEIRPGLLINLAAVASAREENIKDLLRHFAAPYEESALPARPQDREERAALLKPIAAAEKAPECRAGILPSGTSPVTVSRIGMHFATRGSTHYAAVTTHSKLRPHAAMTEDSTRACLAAGSACARACLRCAKTCAGNAARSELGSVLRDCFTACVLWLADVYENERSLRSSSFV
jgi:hypothetical protein